MEPEVGEFTSVSTGVKLYTQHWKPAGAPTAVVVFHHGYGDHVGRYQHVFKRLAASGFAVHTFDALGHGRSAAHPKRGRYNVQKFEELVDDAAAFAAHVLDTRHGGGGGATPRVPAFMMGCSLGGLVSTYTVLRDQARWAKGGLVLMSPAMDVEWNFVLRVQAPMGALLAVVLPDVPLVPAVRAEDLSRNPAVVEAHKADTMVPHGNTKCRMGYECLQGFRNLQPRYKDLTVPLLVQHGGADRITSMPASKRMFNEASSVDKTYRLWEGAYHELFNEPESGQVLDFLVSWLSDHAAAGSKL